MDHSYDSAQLEKIPQPPTKRREGPIPPTKALSTYREPPAFFPKEFNKSYLRSFDRRFFLILLLILTVEPALIIYLLSTQPPGMDAAYVAKLQNKYADLFLSEFVVEKTPEGDSPQNELLLYATEYVPEIVGETFGREHAPSPSQRPGAGTPEARGATKEASEAQRRFSSAVRERAREALSEEVGRIGLLGIITSGSRIISYEPVEDILAYADANANNLEETLSKVKSLRVPRAGVDYYGPAVGDFSGTKSLKVSLQERHVRGGRQVSSGVNPEEFVTGLAEASKKEVEANRSFETIQAVPSLAGLRSRPATKEASRDPQKMREIVLSHQAVIQDCYRQELKRNPTLKGKVTIKFTISPSGKVVDASVITSTLNLPRLDDCILKKMHRWNDFGEVEASVGSTTIRQTFAFGY